MAASTGAAADADADAPIIRVRGLVNRFGRQIVHDGLNLEVRRNEIMGIVGGSGAGKSVLLRTILGLRRPQAGTVEVYGRDIEQLTPAERLAMVKSYGVTFQNGALISSLTVAQNIQLPLRESYSIQEDALDELVQLNLSLVGLAPDAAGKYPAQLSGGMVKRAALARALALEPKLLFLDEPTSGLDEATAERLLNDLVASSVGKTVLYVTHRLDELTSFDEVVRDGLRRPGRGRGRSGQAGEEDPDLPGGGLGRVGAVHQVLGRLNPEVTPDGAWSRLSRIRGAHHQPDHGEGVLRAFDHHGESGRAGD